ncbi:MAG: (2Fe-2S) ferredoxin domain-containing protein [Sphaerochaetaceae bacterium]|nr:(2Fe-2S) ferredoxin domain-containing protein [Sphaerochaetaceae bacterium]MDD3366457.1 (2Fe-2S) ferredoxin domain-containing protein [Sphaerochaetaceae bacterium]MDD4219564.1 (2Fe-2S) ferredoxin domain-containing protein [Sphaerochaetaceae bacterium]MDY0372243.1 (2Fe-2S) ferredoxin domain-containing protein [Sphaerochaetaceae bacterium]
MAKMTLEELRKLRDSKKFAIKKRDIEGKDTQIIVGMGTCGIAAGAKVVLDAFLQELDAQQLENVSVTQSGCMGLCYVEPTVEVIAPDMPPVIYGKVDAAVAKTIIRDHIMHKKMVSDHVFDRPSVDIIKDGGK